MKEKTLRILCFATCLCFIIAGTGCQKDTGACFSSETYTGTFGFYGLNDSEAVQSFNSKIKQWFTEHGFIEMEGMACKDVIPALEWDMPGTILLLKHDDENLVYFFIPDHYRPEKNSQIIGYHITRKGTCEEVKKYKDDFVKLRNNFLEEFPPNVKSEGGEERRVRNLRDLSRR